MPPPRIEIDPPLVNSSSPWATTLEDLQALYACPYIGAVTTRTSLVKGFAHNDAIHQYTFFDPAKHTASRSPGASETSSLNTLGYSPFPLETYLDHIRAIAATSTTPHRGFIVSVTGTPDEVAEAYLRVASAKAGAPAAAVALPLAVEINLSCPNIAGAPPPAYSAVGLRAYLDALKRAVAGSPHLPLLPLGVKTPPYTHADQFAALALALAGGGGGGGGGHGRPSPVSFVTATNTLGCCLVLDGEAAVAPVLRGESSDGVGGMGGTAIHPLSLGNVGALRRVLDARAETAHVRVIGVGGVEDAGGYKRMRSAGAYAVGVGTALGRKGVGVFAEIEAGLGGTW